MLIGGTLLLASVFINLPAMGLGFAAINAVLQLTLGVGLGVLGYTLNGLFSGNWSVDSLQTELANSIFFVGVTVFISSVCSAIKYAARSRATAKLAQETQFSKDPFLGQQAPEKITGYTRHGLDQAMFRDGHGVSPQGILDAVRNPTEIVYDAIRDTYKFNGIHSVTILNTQGKVITTWAKSSVFWRY